MTLATKVTSLRLILAPIFFMIYLLHRFFPASFAAVYSSGVSGSETLVLTGVPWTVPVLWIIFVVSEITDVLDGMIARRRGEVNDFGKLFDPFADTITQITYFFCFVLDGILPSVLFLAVLYREFSILFIRNLMVKKGIALGARMGGKIKTVTYVLSGGLALLASSVVRLGISGGWYLSFVMAAGIVFIVSVIIAIASLIDYVSVYLNTTKSAEQITEGQPEKKGKKKA